MIYRIVSRNLVHRPMRTFLTVAAIGVEVCLILLIWGTTEGLVQEANRRRAGTGADILIRHQQVRQLVEGPICPQT